MMTVELTNETIFGRAAEGLWNLCDRGVVPVALQAGADKLARTCDHIDYLWRGVVAGVRQAVYWYRAAVALDAVEFDGSLFDAAS